MFETVIKSPSRQLREHFESLGFRVGGGLRVDSWTGLDCGDAVRERDGRHTGSGRRGQVRRRRMSEGIE